MAKYIDCEAVLEKWPCCDEPAEAYQFVRDFPAADVQPVVYCKDCKYYGQKSLNLDFPVIDEWCSKLGFVVPSLFYCAYGERRAEEQPPELTEKEN